MKPFQTKEQLMEVIQTTVENAKLDGHELVVCETNRGKWRVRIDGRGIGSVPTSAVFWVMNALYVAARKN